jgi:hypothetical protein
MSARLPGAAASGLALINISVVGTRMLFEGQATDGFSVWIIDGSSGNTSQLRFVAAPGLAVDAANEVREADL